MTKMEVVVDLYNWNTHCNVVLIASNQASKRGAVELSDGGQKLERSRACYS